jgi:hypothetical protein
MQQLLYYVMAVLAIGCGGPDKGDPAKERPATIETASEPIVVYATIGSIPVPEGYTRTAALPGTFAIWLRQVPLKKDKTVYLYNGNLKRNQSAQFAVIDIATGTKDLQQCADAVMRLRAEYLFAQKKYDSIAFMDYSGKWYRWPGGNNRSTFDNYLQTVFGWCGSASLEKQLRPLPRFDAVKAGDVLVQGGFPGHAMMVVDIAVNKNGKKVFMLAQGYQPAQDMHVLINPVNEALSPWYEIPGDDEILTPEWRFTKSNLRDW